MSSGHSRLVGWVLCIGVFVGVMAPAERVEASICFGPVLPSVGNVIAPLAAGVAGIPAYAANQGKGSLALGGGASTALYGGGGVPGGTEMQADILGEWGRHGYRATSFAGYRAAGCDLKFIGDLSASYSYRVVDREGSVVRMELGMHYHFSAIGPVVGLSYDGRLTDSLRFGARLRSLPDLAGAGVVGLEVLTRVRASTRLQWMTGGKFHPYVAVNGGNAFTGRGYSMVSARSAVYVNGMLGLEFRSEGDW